jgi:hypothetical protein
VSGQAGAVLRGALAADCAPEAGPAGGSAFRRRAGLPWVAVTGLW